MYPLGQQLVNFLEMRQNQSVKTSKKSKTIHDSSVRTRSVSFASSHIQLEGIQDQLETSQCSLIFLRILTMTHHLVVVLALAAVHLTKKVLTAKTIKEVEMGASLLETTAMEEAVLQSRQCLHIRGGGSGRQTK